MGTRITSVGKTNAPGAPGWNYDVKSIWKSVGDGSSVANHADRGSVNGRPRAESCTAAWSYELEGSVLEN